MTEFIYPSADEVIEANKIALEIRRITKAEKHELKKPKESIQFVIDAVKAKEGDFYFKAAALMYGLNRLHPFGSANKRTAFLVANNFLWENQSFAVLKREKDKKNVDMLKKIRAGQVTEKDIAKWLKN